jgi:putative flippase GtrA
MDIRPPFSPSEGSLPHNATLARSRQRFDQFFTKFVSIRALYRAILGLPDITAQLRNSPLRAGKLIGNGILVNVIIVHRRRCPIPTITPPITPVRRFIRFALVGLLCVPINLLLLALFLRLLGESLYPVALVASFEISTTINFVLNQMYTYGERKPVRHWDWLTRALKLQVTNLSSQFVTFIGILLLKEQLGLNPYVASLIGMAGAFLYNFTVSNRFVFLPRSKSQGKEPLIHIKN